MKNPGGRPRNPVQTTADRIPKVDYLTVEQAAALTGNHIHTIQARLRDGTLKGKKLGGVWRIYPESLISDRKKESP